MPVNSGSVAQACLTDSNIKDMQTLFTLPLTTAQVNAFNKSPKCQGCQGFKNFMQDRLGYSQIGASSVRSAYTAFCDIVPLLTAYIADEHVGRFKLVSFSGVWYVVGITLLTFAAHPYILEHHLNLANVCFLISIFVGIAVGN
ncbi:hypothetical protein THRCLA_21590 [Thraustotheca clavata]|uniref:Major facilitator superfamily (MFS) profile domain-containing protein n=1 Tax=Thraustotheca clavata TaxID=74557 RepID=A0A1V9ZV35_9STRA|nr:hypothetical protein THRCLA_21590 [Thraustotheca clavata]